LALGVGPLVAVAMGVVTATFEECFATSSEEALSSEP
jgi:hypothetical protein